MWYITAAAAAVLGSMIIGAVKSRGTAGKEPAVPDLLTSVSLNADEIRTLSWDQIEFMLARLETEKPPEAVFGAMCYEMMALPPVAEYVCPVCGEKTLYEDNLTAFIEWELQGARRLAESINATTEFSVVLDETLFCDFCSEGSDEGPGMLLRVTCEDGSEIVNRVSLTDLRKLSSFLHGRLYWLTDNDSQEPLQSSADRLRTLLGLPETEE